MIDATTAVLSAGAAMTAFCSLCAIASKKFSTDGLDRGALAAVAGGAATVVAYGISSVPQMANLANIHGGAGLAGAAAAGAALVLGAASQVPGVLPALKTVKAK